jgi:RimJ/RimL family protein N-acetyltransferase
MTPRPLEVDADLWLQPLPDSSREEYISLHTANFAYLQAAGEVPDFVNPENLGRMYGWACEDMENELAVVYSMRHHDSGAGYAGVVREPDDRTKGHYWVDELHQGKGLATRAMRRILREVFDTTDTNAVDFVIRSSNIPSQRVVGRLGAEIISDDAESQTWRVHRG